MNSYKRFSFDFTLKGHQQISTHSQLPELVICDHRPTPQYCMRLQDDGIIQKFKLGSHTETLVVSRYSPNARKTVSANEVVSYTLQLVSNDFENCLDLCLDWTTERFSPQLRLSPINEIRYKSKPIEWKEMQAQSKSFREFLQKKIEKRDNQPLSLPDIFG